MDKGTWLIAFVVLQRVAELGLAQWNTARLRATGGVEFGASHYPLIVALHASWLLGLLVFGHACLNTRHTVGAQISGEV